MTRRGSVIAVLALLGAWRWSAFLGHGNDGLLTWQDWQRVAYYYASVDVAWRTGSLPLYYGPFYDAEWLNFMWAHPSSPVLPYLLLVPFVPPGLLNLGVCLAYYAAGVAGVVALARQGAWPFPVAVLGGVLLLGHGYLADNLHAGHDAFIAVWLFPWWLWFLRGLLDDDVPALPAHADLWLAALLAVVILGGGAHLAVWWIVTLGLAVATRPSAWAMVARAGAWTVLFSAPKVVPAMIAFPTDALRRWPAWYGYQSFAELWAALIGGQPMVRAMVDLPFMWDRSCYVGPYVATFVLVGAVVPLFLPTTRARAWRLMVGLVPWLLTCAGNTTAGWHGSTNPVLAHVFADRLGTRLLVMPVIVWLALALDVLALGVRHLDATVRAWVGVVVLLAACAVAVDFSGYMTVVAPRFTSIAATDPPLYGRLKPPTQVPTGTHYGVMPLARVEHDATHADLTFNDMHRASIRLGLLMMLAGLSLACSEIVREGQR